MSFTIHKHHALTLAIILLLLGSPVSFAQHAEEQHPDQFRDPWVADVYCRGDGEREAIGFIGDREFRLCFKFDEKLLQPTSAGTPSYCDLYITSYTKRGQPNLTEIELVREYPDDHPGLIIEKATPFGPVRDAGSFSSARDFKVRVQITNQSRSDRYPIAFRIVSNNETASQNGSFRLPILAQGDALISVDKKPRAFIDCWTGSACSPLQLEVRNKLPYKLKISNVSISSEDLLEDRPTGNYSNDIEVNSAPHDLNLILKAKPISLGPIFTGFGRQQVFMRIDFKDEYGRRISKETTADLKIRPNFLVIGICLIIGALVGTLLRFLVGRLHHAGIISRRQRAVFAATTFASGIIICVFALIAEIKLIVWSDQNTFYAWDPKVLCLTALVATMSGLPILYEYLKLPRTAKPRSQKADSSDADTNSKF